MHFLTSPSCLAALIFPCPAFPQTCIIRFIDTFAFFLLPRSIRILETCCRVYRGIINEFDFTARRYCEMLRMLHELQLACAPARNLYFSR